MKIPIYQVDAFTDRMFQGNPAAVCPLDSWLHDEKLQLIAFENNLSETAFFVRGDRYCELRWFTPEIEVDLCGHATLAASHVLFEFIDKTLKFVEFSTKSGILKVEKENDLLSMNFPARRAAPCPTPDELVHGLGIQPIEVYKARDYLVIYDSEEKIKTLRPNMGLLSELDCLGVIVTSQGERADFVSRFFAPRAGIPEDPVTGSAHCTLVPHWAERLGKNKLRAFQLSRRGGEIYCENLGDRVKISGKAVTYLAGFIYV